MNMNLSRRSHPCNLYDMPLWTELSRATYLKHLLEEFQTHDSFCWAQVGDTGSVCYPVRSEVTSIENKSCNLTSQLSPETNLQHPDFNLQKFLYEESFNRALGHYLQFVATWCASNSVDRVYPIVSTRYSHTLRQKNVMKLILPMKPQDADVWSWRAWCVNPAVTAQTDIWGLSMYW